MLCVNHVWVGMADCSASAEGVSDYGEWTNQRYVWY